MNFYTLPHQEVRYKNTLPVGINFTKFLKFLYQEVRYMVYLPKRAGKYKILSRVKKILPRAAKPQGEVFFHKGEYFITYPTAWGGIVFLYSPDRRRIWSISRKK